MRRLVIALCAAVLIGFTLPVFGIEEIGIRVQIGLPRFGGASGGQWAASFETYIDIELDAAWTLQTGIGLSSLGFSPHAWLGLSRTFWESFQLLGDVALRWIPRRGLLSRINTGLRFQGPFTASSDLIVESFPLQFRVESREHLLYLVPEFVPSVSLGGAILVEHGWCGELLTISAYRAPSRRQSFALFVGNEWYLTVQYATTIFGYRP